MSHNKIHILPDFSLRSVKASGVVVSCRVKLNLDVIKVGWYYNIYQNLESRLP